MEKRFFRYYPFLSTVAASAVAVFIFSDHETSVLPIRNLFVTLFIYYNYMALYYPTKEKVVPAGIFFVMSAKARRVFAAVRCMAVERGN